MKEKNIKRIVRATSLSRDKSSGSEVSKFGKNPAMNLVGWTLKYGIHYNRLSHNWKKVTEPLIYSVVIKFWIYIHNEYDL